MVEERITTHETPSGQPTHTTVVTHSTGRGGSGWVIGLVLLVALIVGIFMFSRMSGSEMAKDNAVANAANQVGNAASRVGDAAQQAGSAARDAADNVADK